MIYEFIRAEDYCDSVRDGTHDTPKPTERGYKLVTGKHVKNGQIDPTDAYYISEKEYKKINERSLVEQWDVLMSMIGTVGEVAVVKNTPDYAIKNVALFKCGGSELKGKWLSYYLQSPIAKGHMNGNQKGSSQQFLSLKQLRDLPVIVADESLMQKIVDILSAYDNLIENNQKQIKLLEEAAQRLYKEWFIDLRFPGHQSTPIVNGFPEGWIMGTLGQIAEFKRGKTITKAQVIPGVVPVVAGGLEPAYYHNTANTKAPVITVSASGANAGFTKMYHIDVFASDCSFADSTTTSYLGYVFCVMQSAKEKLRTMQKGSAQPHVYAKDINALSVLIPDRLILESFCKIVSQLFERIGMLEAQNIRLAEARDCLLPKLMHGELEV